jgi:hypothetical protein
LLVFTLINVRDRGLPLDALPVDVLKNLRFCVGMHSFDLLVPADAFGGRCQKQHCRDCDDAPAAPGDGLPKMAGVAGPV